MSKEQIRTSSKNGAIIEKQEERNMAIDLTTLNTTEIIPQNTHKTASTYRIDQNKIKENWEEKTASATNLIEESKKNGSYRESAVLDGSGIGNISAGKGIYCNYSSDAFFRKDMPLLADEKGNYTIGGVKFTREELEECRAVMKAAVDGIGCGIGKNANIDYRNYAEMEIAAGGVRQYAGEKLTEQQAEVVNKAMQEYNDALIKLEKDTLERAGVVKINGSDVSQYYGKAQPISQKAIERAHKLNKNSKMGNSALGTVQSATNDDLINRIRDLFSKIDYSDSASFDSAKDKYKEYITPTKVVLGATLTDGSLPRALDYDVSGLQNMFRNMMNAIRYHSVDYRL